MSQKFIFNIFKHSNLCHTTIITVLLLNVTVINCASTGNKKQFGERRLSVDSDLRIQYHDRGAALTEWDDENTLISCELVSISDNSTFNRLKGLIIDEPKLVTFEEFNELSDHCDNLAIPLKKKTASIFSKETLNIVSGIFPGTKWCGSSNLANSYHDLGQRADLDRCCRKHDFCPIKIRGHETRYNITNTSKYTKLHCDCDEQFYMCLKKVDNKAANLVGRTYFNISKHGCFEKTSDGNYEFKKTKKEY